MRFSKLSQAVAIATLLFTSAGVLALGSKEPATKRFVISGSQSVELLVADEGPLPASAEGVTVEMVGPMFGPSKGTPGQLALIWAFSLSVPTNAKFKSVTIENVSEQVAESVLSQVAPKAQLMKAPDGKEFNILQLRGAAKDVSKEITPWVFQDGLSTLIFRIVLESESGKSNTLYQATQFPESQKSQIRQMAAKSSQKK